jgi:FAS-associated factor 2
MGPWNDSSTRVRCTTSLVTRVSAAAPEAMEFVEVFEREYGATGPRFVRKGFLDALQRSRSTFKLKFVYQHSPDHLNTVTVCERTLCSEAIAEFVNENSVSWVLSNSLKTSRFPFCAVVMTATNQRLLCSNRLRDQNFLKKLQNGV